VIVLDTHVLIWLDEGSSRLGKKALQAIDAAFQQDTLFVSVISFWEVAMLVEKGRLEMSVSVDQWRKSLLANGLREIALNGDMAVQSAGLEGFHGDPADRMIVATALYKNATLCTADGGILHWKPYSQWLDASQ